jgi:glycerol-3-phosphate dehydrogenase
VEKLTTYRPLSEEVVDMLKPLFPQISDPWTADKILPMIDFQFSPDEKTLRHFIRHEWARNFDDVVWRRTKWGLTLSKNELKNLKILFERIINEENSGH